MRFRILTCLFTVAALCTSLASAETRLLRYPDVHGDKVVFTYAGNLWSAPVTGGTATQLTSHPGLELFAEFSPDGEWIAFTGQYNGNEQVYVMPAVGGEPKQLTFYPSQGPLPARWGYDHLVQGWTPDGERILFRSLRDAWSLGEGRLFTVHKDGGLPEPLPLPSAGAATFTDDANSIFYSPLMRDFRTWKRYQGGWAQDLWLLDLKAMEAEQVTDHVRTDRDPMWIDGQAYFVSDRTGRLNLYRYDRDGGEAEQLTDYADWDVRWPGTDGEHRIAYELNGAIHVYDVRSGEDRRLSIEVPSDVLPARPRQVKVAEQVEHFALSPKGKRALFVARGDVFSAPVDKGLTRNLTHSSNAHEREVAWSPKGDRVAFVSDVTGEEQVYVMHSDGTGKPVQISGEAKTRYNDPRFSPDGEYVAWHDAEGRILVAAADGDGKPAVAANEAQGFTNDYAWSPDSRWLAFSLSEPSGFRSIHVWNRKNQSLRRLTDESFNDHTPAWSPDGKVLYFLGDRMFQPQIGNREFNYQLVRQVAVLGVTLTSDAKRPYPPEDADPVIKDEEGKEKENGDKKDGKKDERPEVEIQFENLDDRVFQVPNVSPENYAGLAVTDKHILFLKRDAFFYGRQPETKPKLMMYDIEKREAKARIEEIDSIVLSPDLTHALVQQGESYKVHELAKKDADPENVSTNGLVADIEPRQEWRTMFAEAWRRFRDYFYVENMHGLDWRAVRDQYEPLVEHVAHRSDLNYVIGEMIAELNSSHAYIASGDEGLPDRPNVALLGARFELDDEAGHYRFSKIFDGDNDSENYRSPLTEVGVNVSVGDYLLAVNGKPLEAGANPYDLLQVAAGQPVELTVNDSPDMDDARKVLVEPISSESPLVYNEWVAENRRKVAEATDGRVGYIHIPDMGSSGIREFIKWYYPQIRKEGLVVDVRSNGGGNVSQMLIERLSRDLLALTYARYYERPGTYPNQVFHGHMVCLINETSASDGDIFPWMFKTVGLGPVIGQRSWGGVIGITSHGPLLDGGQVYVPQFGYANADGEWDVEGHGVEPDIWVGNDPIAILEGRDPQLQQGIQEIMQRIRNSPKTIPGWPEAPVKVD